MHIHAQIKYIYRERDVSTCIKVYVYNNSMLYISKIPVYIDIHIHMYKYIYICVQREIKRERERESEIYCTPT